jgi:hypothetical protein
LASAFFNAKNGGRTPPMPTNRWTLQTNGGHVLRRYAPFALSPHYKAEQSSSFNRF